MTGTDLNISIIWVIYFPFQITQHGEKCKIIFGDRTLCPFFT